MTKTSLCLCVVPVLATVVSLAHTGYAADQPKIGSRQVPVLVVDGLRFRDLNCNAQLDAYEDWRLSPEVRAADLTGRMSLAEKAGTMLHGTLLIEGDQTAALGDRGNYDLEKARDMVLRHHVTTAISRLRFAEPSDIATQHNTLQELAEQGRLGIPLTISTDPRNHLEAEGFEATPGISLWPAPIGFGSIGDVELMRQFSDIMRREYRALGIHMALSPQADLATEPRWGRIAGTFGEDPTKVRDLVRAYVEGAQGGSEGLTRGGVITIVKHWAGYGAAIEKGLDGHYPYGRWSGFPGGAFEQHLVPYDGAFAVKVAGVMPTYTILRDLVYNGHPMDPVGGAFNQYLLTDMLRGQFGFEGMILSDFLVTGDARSGYDMAWGMETATRLDRYVKGVRAGIDQFGGVEETEHLIEAVESGVLDEQQLDVSVQRILVDKFRIGLFENPYVSPEAAEVIVRNPAAHAEAKAAQWRSLVLLKNEESILPLGDTPTGNTRARRVYLIGISADVAEAKGLTVVTDVSQADLVIARLTAPNEGPKRLPEGNLAFAPGQSDFDSVVSLSANGLPVIATVYLDRPAVMTALLPHVQGLFGDFGITDEALLEVMFGEAEPEGRLPFELPSSMAAVEAQMSDLPHDSESPLFPIGFGLRYQE